MFVATEVVSKIKLKTRKYHHQFTLNNAATHSENCLLEVALFSRVGDVKLLIPFLFSGSLMFKLGEACNISLLFEARSARAALQFLAEPSFP